MSGGVLCKSFVARVLIAAWCVTSAACGGTVPLVGSADVTRNERVWIVSEDIAVLGQSLGGATVIGLTRKNCCRDVRVRATILSAAPFLPGSFGPDPISTAGPPTLILQGTADTTVTYATATLLYKRIDPPRFLVGLQGAEHADALESQVEPPIPARAAGQRATIAFLNAVFRGAAAELDVTLSALAADGNIVQAEPRGAAVARRH